jgi:hypothetical protein
MAVPPASGCTLCLGLPVGTLVARVVGAPTPTRGVKTSLLLFIRDGGSIPQAYDLVEQMLPRCTRVGIRSPVLAIEAARASVSTVMAAVLLRGGRFLLLLGNG